MYKDSTAKRIRVEINSSKNVCRLKLRWEDDVRVDRVKMKIENCSRMTVDKKHRRKLLNWPKFTTVVAKIEEE